MKFIIKHNNGMMDINKLFVVACCNGHEEMAKLLMDVDNNVDCETAFEGACYFGHYGMINYLLKYDIKLNDEMLWMCIHGIKQYNKSYSKILEKCNITYDVFNHCEDHMEILKLLLGMGMVNTIDMFKNIRCFYYNMTIIMHMIDNGHSINDLLGICVNITGALYEPPKNIYPIVKYLLDNGGHVDIGNVRDKTMRVFLENYNNGCL